MTLSKDDKERLVIDLYKKDKTRPEIARIVKMSFSRIQFIIKRYEDSLPSKTQSKCSQALALFSEGLKPLSVAIQLDIPPATAESHYLDYKRLVGLSGFANLYADVGESLVDFISFYKEVRLRNITIDNVKEAISASMRLPGILEQLARASVELQQKQIYLLQAREAQQQLNSQYEVSRQLVISETSKLTSISQQVQIMNDKYSNLNSVIERLKIRRPYQEFKQLIEWAALSVIKNHGLIIAIAFAAVVKALGDEEILNSQKNVKLDTSDLADRLVESANLIFDGIFTGIRESILHRTMESLNIPIPTTISENWEHITELEKIQAERMLKSQYVDTAN
jgi:hypothetical protein